MIQNGSFEDTLKCPSNGNQLKYALFWDTLIIGGGGSPDFYSRCSNSIVNVPNNFFGYQIPKSGDNYGGIGLYVNTTNVFREYMQNKLKKINY